MGRFLLTCVLCMAGRGEVEDTQTSPCPLLFMFFLKILLKLVLNLILSFFLKDSLYLLSVNFESLVLLKNFFLFEF